MVITVLGIDPGSRITGFGVIKISHRDAHYITSGCIKTPKGPLADRLYEIYDNITSLMADYQPDEVAIENVFMHKNAQSALKLGQARGVAMLAARLTCPNIFEYSPRQIKQAVVGHGGALKAQIQEMVTHRLNLSAHPQVDAADGLAIALTHFQMRTSVTARVKSNQKLNLITKREHHDS